jgi:hypothetical protein
MSIKSKEIEFYVISTPTNGEFVLYETDMENIDDSGFDFVNQRMADHIQEGQEFALEAKYYGPGTISTLLAHYKKVGNRAVLVKDFIKRGFK